MPPAMVVKRLLLVFQMPNAGPPGQTDSLSREEVKY